MSDEREERAAGWDWSSAVVPLSCLFVLPLLCSLRQGVEMKESSNEGSFGWQQCQIQALPGAPWWCCGSDASFAHAAVTSAEGKLLQMLCTPHWESSKQPRSEGWRGSKCRLPQKVAVFRIRIREGCVVFLSEAAGNCDVDALGPFYLPFLPF